MELEDGRLNRDSLPGGLVPALQTGPETASSVFSLEKFYWQQLGTKETERRKRMQGPRAFRHNSRRRSKATEKKEEVAFKHNFLA